MSYLWRGVDLFQQCEWGGSSNKHAIANSGYRLGERILTAANRAPVTTTSGFIYSSETFTPTGLLLSGQQVVLQRPGCRPRFHGAQRTWSLAASSNASLTRFINRFSDGSVWISTAANVRSGTQISWPTAGTTLPRGVRYVTVLLIGAGGGGGGAGGSLQQSGSGGGGGAVAACCVRLPENGHATLTIGGWGNGGVNYNAGQDGHASSILCGDYLCMALGGARGQTAGNSNNTAWGGQIVASQNNADGVLFASANGGDGPGRNNTGRGASMTINEYAPESASLFFSSNGGASGGNSGGGGGGASAYWGQGGNGGNGARGSDGQGFGGGGGGGGIAFLQQHPGGRGAPGYVEVRY